MHSSQKITTAAYYYPGFHRHPKLDQRKKPGFTEWDLILNAKPRFPGHEQPRLPLWGAKQESDPEAMEKKIDAAADHGLDAFIFDWYYHDEGPFLEGLCRDSNALRADEFDAQIRFTVLKQHLDDLLHIPLQFVESLCLRMRSRESGDVADIETRVGASLDNRSVNFHEGMIRR